MNAEFVTCPHCHHSVELTEVLTHHIREDLLKELQPRLEQQALELKRKSEQLAEREAEIDRTIEERMKAQTRTIERIANERARESFASNMNELTTKLEMHEDLLRQSREKEKQFYQKEFELQQKLESQQLEITRAVSQKAVELRNELEQKARLREMEYQIERDAFQKKLDEMQKRLEQGSMQLQGEAFEIELENFLRSTFPQDHIEEVGKGQRGGDCVQRVYNALGNHAGTILWEVKRTKNFSDAWVQKLKDDMIAAKADVGVILTLAMPKEIETFGEMNGVWITNQSCLLGLASALRSQLVAVANQRQFQAGRQTKADLLYEFMSGAEFVQRIESIVTPFIELQEALAQEKRAMTRIWSAREKQLMRVVDSISGLTGSLSGIMGKTLEIGALELKALPEGE